MSDPSQRERGARWNSELAAVQRRTEAASSSATGSSNPLRPLPLRPTYVWGKDIIARSPTSTICSGTCLGTC